jgi:hypothetical protein
MANWTAEGFVGKTFSVTERCVSRPSGIPAPILWGDETVVRERLGQASKIDTVRRKFLFEHALPPREMVQFFRQYFGPTQMAFSRLETAGQAAYAAELESLWREHNESKDGTTLVRSEYLEVIATPPKSQVSGKI